MNWNGNLQLLNIHSSSSQIRRRIHVQDVKIYVLNYITGSGYIIRKLNLNCTTCKMALLNVLQLKNVIV